MNIQKYELHKYSFKAYDQSDKVHDILYLDVQKYQYLEGQGIRIITKVKTEYLIKNYWFDYNKPDPDDKFKFECFERDLHRILFLNEWQNNRVEFIKKHYIPLEKFNEIKTQKKAILDEYLNINGLDAENSIEYQSLLSSFSLLQHKSQQEVENELTIMAEHYSTEMKEFDYLKQTISILSFEKIALDLYGDPILFEEEVNNQNDFLVYDENY